MEDSESALESDWAPPTVDLLSTCTSATSLKEGAAYKGRLSQTRRYPERQRRPPDRYHS